MSSQPNYTADCEIDVKRGVRSKIPGQIIFEDGWIEGRAVSERGRRTEEQAAGRAEGKLDGISQAEAG